MANPSIFISRRIDQRRSRIYRSTPFPTSLPVPSRRAAPRRTHHTAPMAASASASGAGKSLRQTFRKFFKRPWEITGPCASPEYRSALPGALEYRQTCPATLRENVPRAVIPTSVPETVYDIKYYTRDCRRNRPPVRRTLLRKPDLERYMAAKQFDPAKDFPVPYVKSAIEEDYDAVGGGYTK